MTQRYVDSPWYGKIWAFLKQFPQGLAEGAKRSPATSGPAAAAIISAGIGCFLMMVAHHFGSSVCVMQWTGVIRDETII